MGIDRSRKTEKAYASYLKQLPTGICIFCEGHSEVLLEDYKLFKVIQNIFPYAVWDGQKVTDHIMVTPKMHCDSIAHFTEEMVAEMHKLISKYEARGYNVYARAPSSAMKSIAHQHTHLIKTEGRTKRVILLSRKPYIKLAF